MALDEPLLDNLDEEITNWRQFWRNYKLESKKLWYLAGPAIFTAVAQYSLGAITQVFAGHLTTLELDAVSTENMVIAGLAFGIMLGMGSALETLCGQAFGAKQLHMLGVYMQRSWVILNITCVCLVPIYVFASPILKFFGQNSEIAELAGRFSLYMIPQLFAYGFNFPLQKFLQAQSKVLCMAYVAAFSLLLHIFLSWLLIVRLKLGLPGAATSLNISWWVNVLGQFIYIVLGYCPHAWNGFTWGACHSLWAFFRLSIASAIMLCLEFWYYMILLVLAGLLKNAQIAVGAMSICTNINGWEIMIFLGLNAAISVRISNELGAGRPRAAKFAILVVVMQSALLGFVFFAFVLALKDVYALPFTNSAEVAKVVSNLAPIFALTLLLNSVQPVLSGVAVGAGWQWLVAYVNLGCYYLVGIPLGFFMGTKLNLGVKVCHLSLSLSLSARGSYVLTLQQLIKKSISHSLSKLNLGVKGVWGGMITGVGLQTIIIAIITFLTNWKKEALGAESRIRKWGGSVEPLVNDDYKHEAIFNGSENKEIVV